MHALLRKLRRLSESPTITDERGVWGMVYLPNLNLTHGEAGLLAVLKEAAVYRPQDGDFGLVLLDEPTIAARQNVSIVVHKQLPPPSEREEECAKFYDDSEPSRPIQLSMPGSVSKDRTTITIECRFHNTSTFARVSLPIDRREGICLDLLLSDSQKRRVFKKLCGQGTWESPKCACRNRGFGWIVTHD
jgi:hypothetical protein